MRIRVHTKNGSFLARKGSTMQEMKAWKSAYNRYNKDKVGRLEVVKDRKPSTRKKTNTYSIRDLI